MSNPFREIDRHQPMTLPGDLAGWRDGNDLARFIGELVEVLDTREIEDASCGGGSAPYPPKMRRALWVYCDAKGIFSRRQIERAPSERIPVRYLTGGTPPDPDRINTFRQRFLPPFEALLVRVWGMAHELGVLKRGEVSLEGAKIDANARTHHALSGGDAERLEQPLKAAVQTLLERAAAVSAPGAVERDLPAELKRREDRRAKMAEVNIEIERRAPERYGRERAEYEAQPAERAAQERARGRKWGGKTPREPVPGPRPAAQVTFTDGDARIMPGSGGGFEHASNAPATVPMGSLLIIGAHVTPQGNDKQERAPALAELAKRPETWGAVERMAAANGSCSQHHVEIVVHNGSEPLIAVGRQSHHETLAARWAPVPDAPHNPDAVTAMTPRLKTPEGQACYAKRKTPSEPGLGIIKEVMGFRRFWRRGLDQVKGEWRLVCLAFNLKRLGVLHQGVTAS